MIWHSLCTDNGALRFWWWLQTWLMACDDRRATMIRRRWIWRWAKRGKDLRSATNSSKPVTYCCVEIRGSSESCDCVLATYYFDIDRRCGVVCSNDMAYNGVCLSHSSIRTCAYFRHGNSSPVGNLVVEVMGSVWLERRFGCEMVVTSTAHANMAKIVPF